MISVFVGVLYAQTAAPPSVSSGLPASPGVSETNARIFFLNIQATDAQRRQNGDQSDVLAAGRASILHVGLRDLRVIDEIAIAFLDRQTALKNESIVYFRQQQSLKSPLDAAIVHSFTTRREALANRAFTQIQSRISKEGDQGFERYFELEFRKSVHRRR